MWGIEDIDFVLQNYQNMTYNDIGKAINKSKGSIATFLHRNNINKNFRKDSYNKKCKQCNKIYILDNFHIKNSTTDSTYSICKNCRSVIEHNRYIDNKVEKLNKRKEYRINNSNKIKIQKRTDYEKHKYRYYDSNRKRRDRKNNIQDTILSKNFTDFILSKFNHQCFKCSTTNNLSIDHHNPLILGFKLQESNAVVLCTKCNSSKGVRIPIQFYTKEEILILLEQYKVVTENYETKAVYPT